jgi:nuclear mRNA export protein SAC3
MRDQVERHEDIPDHIMKDEVFNQITKFRKHVQETSAPITKTSQLRVGSDGMAIFSQLAQVLQKRNNIVMVYLIACTLERLFGKGAIQDDLELIRGDISTSDIIDGVSRETAQEDQEGSLEEIDVDENPQSPVEYTEQDELPLPTSSNSVPPQISSVFGGPTSSPFGMSRRQDLGTAPKNAFSALVSSPSPFAASSVFGGTSPLSVFGGNQRSSAFEQLAPVPVPPLSKKPPEFMSNHSKGLASSPTPPSFFAPAQTVQPTPPVAKSEALPTLSPSKTVLEPPLPRTSLSEAAPLPSKVPLNPNALTFVPLNPSPTIPPLSSSSPHKATQSVSVPNFTAPEFSARSTTQPVEPAPSLPDHLPEEPQATSAARLVERRQTLWDLSGISGPRRPPRINTDLTSDGTTASPKVPPPLKRTEPISLPPTTPHTPLSSHPSFKGIKSLKSFPSIQSIQTPGEILSPLNLTPSINAREFSFTIPADQQPELSAATAELESIAAEGAKTEEGKVNKKRSQWIAEAEEEATCFKRRGVLVKNCFSRWKRRLMDQVEYLEAVGKSEESSKKLRIERELSATVSVSSNGGDRKRRVPGMSPDAAQRKRVRKRQSIKYAPPRTDDDLVKKLQEV